ncbi:hypothetical protein Hanom_Chr11g01020451 [Helianthus anomalus]
MTLFYIAYVRPKNCIVSCLSLLYKFMIIGLRLGLGIGLGHVGQLVRGSYILSCLVYF